MPPGRHSSRNAETAVGVERGLPSGVRQRLGRYRRQLSDTVSASGRRSPELGEVDWEAAAARREVRVPGRVSVVVVPTGSADAATRTANAARAMAGDCELDVRVAPNPGGSASVNTAAADSTGDVLVFLMAGVDVLPGWCEPLVSATRDADVRGAQPLVLRPDGSVASAGRLLPDAAPLLDLMAGHPREDVFRAEPVVVRIASVGAWAVRADDFIEVRGLDQSLTFADAVADFSLRARDGVPRGFRLVSTSLVVDTRAETEQALRGDPDPVTSALTLGQRWWSLADPADIEPYVRAGFTVSGDAGAPPSSRVTRPQQLVSGGPAAGLPSLRWAIKIAAHAGPRGDSWGDVNFAAAMARALESLGQEVVVDRRLAVVRETSYLDDVVLVIRGLDHVIPQSDAVRLLWVISHPELVDADEIDSYDRAFAASEVWSGRLTESGHPVTALLQATDPDMFTPDVPRLDEAEAVLFVGRSRNVLRPIVRDAVAADLPLVIYGDDWAQFGLERFVAAPYLPYDEVPRHYASAGVVLNDHWEDMAAEGFVSNRLFDAVACGARVVSDDVAGLDALFEGAVQVARNADDLRRWCGPSRDAAFPDDQTRRDIAMRVRRDQSFQARARTLLDAALAVRGPA